MNAENAALHRELAELRAALDAHAIVVTTDARGVITAVNDKFCDISKWSREELLGKTHKVINSGFHPPEFFENLWQTIRVGRIWQGDIKNRAKDGSFYWVATTIYPSMGSDGRPASYIAIRADITERKSVEEALARRAELLDRAGALARIGGWEVNLETMKLSWTAETFRIAGLEPPNEPPLEEGINLFAPHVRDVISAAVQAAIDHGTPYDLELPIITARGEKKWVQTQGFGEIQLGKVTRIYGTFQDITERKRAQATVQDSVRRFKTALANSQVSLWEQDLDLRYTWFYNPKLGYAIEAVVGMTDADIMDPACVKELEALKRRVIETRQATRQEVVAAAPGEKFEFYDLWIEPLFNDSGHIVGITCAAADISVRKRVEEALRMLVSEKDALLKEVHHRVKNNLQVITSLLRLESRRSTVDDTKAALGDMQARIRAMALLHESLYRSGTYASVDLGSYLRQLSTQAFQTQSTNAGVVQLELNLGSTQVGMDQAIPCGLLINELISNCLKHGFPTGVTGHVSIDLQPLDTAQQWRLRVCDTGAGLPENFEEKRKNSLGLQLASDLARQIGGELMITPNKDKGVSFTVNFQALEPAPLVMPA